MILFTHQNILIHRADIVVALELAIQICADNGCSRILSLGYHCSFLKRYGISVCFREMDKTQYKTVDCGKFGDGMRAEQIFPSYVADIALIFDDENQELFFRLKYL